MKQILKNILICISIIYLLISLVYNVFYTQISEEGLKARKENQGIVIQENITTIQIEEMINYYTRGGIAQGYENLRILAISSIIGIIIGLYKSLKENSKVKYIFYFVFGNIIYNLLWMLIIAIIINNYVEIIGPDNVDDYFYYLYTNYINVFIKTLISYILIYATILIGNIINNKKKVEELNQSLKGEKQVKTKRINKNIKKAIFIVLIIIVTIFAGNIIRKIVIINKYTKAMENLNESNNYYYKEQKDEGYAEIYYKDGICVTKSNGKLTIYEDENNKQIIRIDSNKKKAYIVDNYTRNTRIENRLYLGYEAKYWHNIMVAFRSKISTEKIEGRKCYIIEIDNQKLYIDKKDNMLFKVETQSDYTKYENGEIIKETKIIMFNCSYEINNVTEQDIVKPDLTGYEIINK